MRRRLVARCLALLLLIPLLSGCWDRLEVEEMAFVAGVGIDSGKDGDYIYTFQMVIPRTALPSGGGGGGGGGGKTIVLFSIAAPSLRLALTASNSFVSRRVTLHHTKAVIIGEDLARQGVAAPLLTALRFKQLRPSVRVLVAKGRASDWIKAAKSKFELNLTRWYELMFRQQEQGEAIPITDLHDLMYAAVTPGVGGMVGLTAVNPKAESDEPPQKVGAPIPADNPARGHTPFLLQPGQLPRTGEIPTEWAGVALFQGDRLVDELPAYDLQLLRITERPHARLHFLTEDIQAKNAFVKLEITNTHAAKVKMSWQGQRMHIAVQVDTEGSLLSQTTLTDYTIPKTVSRLEKQVEQQITKDLKNVMTRVINKDRVTVWRLEDRLRTQFLTDSEFLNFKVSEALAQAEIEVHVTFHLSRIGLLRQPIRPRK